jgi:alanyl-tRNA synthetase
MEAGKEEEEKFDEQTQDLKEVKCLTTKQLKALARPEFEANPDQFYPTKIFKKIGFSRNRCPKC